MARLGAKILKKWDYKMLNPMGLIPRQLSTPKRKPSSARGFLGRAKKEDK